MAGFSRAPSAWKFTFSGMNLKEAADQVPPVQYPLAINIRALADHSIRTRPGYAFLFDGAGTPEPPPPEPGVVPVTACGTLQGDLELRWSHNSRVGMFTNEVLGEFFYIGRDPNNAKRLIAVKTTDFGETWAIADDTFAAHTNDLASFDCHQVQADHVLYATLRNFVYVSMQEATTGRVSLGRFNCATSTWTFTSNEIVASVTGTFMSCGVTVTSTGDIGVLYQTNNATPVSTSRQRCGYRYSSDGGTVWSSELQVGIWLADRNNLPGRPVADSAGRVQIFTGNRSLAVGWGEYWVQTIRADHTLSTETRWQLGSALHQIQSECCMGDYCTFESGGTTRIVYLCRMLFDAHYTLFESSDNLTADYQPTDVRDGDIGTTFNGLGGAGYEANYPQVSARVQGTNIHFMASHYSNTVPTYFYHKSAPPPYAPGDLSPSGDADQAGPIFSLSGSGIPGQEMAAQVIEVEGELYYVSLRNSSGAGFGLIFNFIRLDQLPTSSTETIDVWAAACEST